VPGWQLPAGSQHPAQTPRPHELEEPPILHVPPSDPLDASLDEDPPEELPESCEHVPLPRQIAPTAVQSEHLLPPMPHALSFTPGTQVPVPSQQPLHDGPHPLPPLSSPPVASFPLGLALPPPLPLPPLLASGFEPDDELVPSCASAVLPASCKRGKKSDPPPLAQADPTAPAGRSTMVATTPSLVMRIIAAPSPRPRVWIAAHNTSAEAARQSGRGPKRTAHREGNRLTRPFGVFALGPHRFHDFEQPRVRCAMTPQREGSFAEFVVSAPARTTRKLSVGLLFQRRD
jgi:hypothetical protein